MRILSIEDEEYIQEMIADYFTALGHEVCCAPNGMEGLKLLAQNIYDVILLDIMLPDIDGLTLLKKIGPELTSPVLFVTALEQEEAQLAGYGLGADDYIVKPFSLPVLEAKIHAIVNRGMARRRMMTVGGLKVDVDGRLVLLDGEEIMLPEKEYRILLFLMENRGRVLSRARILDAVWGMDAEVLDRVVDKHILKLRTMLKEYGSLVKTIPKAGYVFAEGERYE